MADCRNKGLATGQRECIEKQPPERKLECLWRNTVLGMAILCLLSPR